MAGDNFYIAIYDKTDDLLSFPYYSDVFESDWLAIPPGKSLAGYVLRTGKSLLATQDVFDQLLKSGDVELVGVPSIDWLGAPLITQKGVIGVMAVQTYSTDVRLTETDREIMTLLSGQAALVIERKQAEDGLRESEQKLFNIVQNYPIPAFIIDRDHQITHWNNALEELTQIPSSQMVNTSDHWRTFYKEARPCLVDLLVDKKEDLVKEWYGEKCQPLALIPGAYQTEGSLLELGKPEKWFARYCGTFAGFIREYTWRDESIEDISMRCPMKTL